MSYDQFPAFPRRDLRLILNDQTSFNMVMRSHDVLYPQREKAKLQ